MIFQPKILEKSMAESMITFVFAKWQFSNSVITSAFVNLNSAIMKSCPPFVYPFLNVSMDTRILILFCGFLSVIIYLDAPVVQDLADGSSFNLTSVSSIIILFLVFI